MVGVGIEPTTSDFSDRRCYQLSYPTIIALPLVRLLFISDVSVSLSANVERTRDKPGLRGRTRTCDLRIRSAALLFPSELHGADFQKPDQDGRTRTDVNWFPKPADHRYPTS